MTISYRTPYGDERSEGARLPEVADSPGASPGHAVTVSRSRSRSRSRATDQLDRHRSGLRGRSTRSRPRTDFLIDLDLPGRRHQHAGTSEALRELVAHPSR